MNKYNFKVYYYDKTYVKVDIESLAKANLSDVDSFTMKYGSLRALSEVLEKDCKINISNIYEIKLQPKNSDSIEFSVIYDNPYLKSVIDSVETKEIPGFMGKLQKKSVISTNNSTYKEMEKYLFDQLETNSKVFTEDIYTYKNEFSKLLDSYVSVIKQPLEHEDEMRNKEDLARKIKRELSVYKNYRGLALVRAKNYNNIKNLNVNFGPASNENKNNIRLSYDFPVKEPIFSTSIEATHKFNTLDDDREEFLEPDEYEDAYGKHYG